MQIIIVADNDLEDFGRKMAHVISLEEDCDAAFWTLKHYRDNEAQIKGEQPAIFLGDNDITKALMEVIPERFGAFQTKCRHAGGRAILIADTPILVSRDDINKIKDANKELNKELQKEDPSTPYVAIADVLTAGGLIGLYLDISARRREYRKLQYQYVVSRFVKDELENFMEKAKRGTSTHGERFFS